MKAYQNSTNTMTKTMTGDQQTNLPLDNKAQFSTRRFGWSLAQGPITVPMRSERICRTIAVDIACYIYIQTCNFLIPLHL